MEQPLVEVKDLVKHFPVMGGPLDLATRGHVRAVDGVNFRIGAGQTLALVGESGCGKTTTAKLLLRLQEATSGSIVIDGQPIQSLSKKDIKRFRMNVQAVFQDPWASLNPRMRVKNIIGEALRMDSSVSKSDRGRRVDQLLERVGLSVSDGDLFPHEFSGGQRQRIALASALITDPKLVVLDEPVSALDVSVQAQVLNLLKDLQDELGTAYLLITHDLTTVRFVADRIAVMYLGEIVEEGPPRAIFENPKHPYTMALFASTLPMHPKDVGPNFDLKGEAPSPINPPSGCRFRTRCPYVMDVCLQTPELTEVGPERRAACHLNTERGHEAVSPSTQVSGTQA